jgi:NADPH:quinone reductase-like Zn-dependent oxidoreductase
MTTTVPAVMRALRVYARDDPGSLRYEEMAVPTVGIGDVLVEVAAASFTPTELGWPSTWVDRAGRDRHPAVPGHELAGTVVALGYGTTGLAVGDEVYGITDWYRDGTLAEYVAIEARDLAPRPALLSGAEVAAVPMAGLTAWQALFTHGGLGDGQTVLIAGAGGGVGTMAVQLARQAGARVIGLGRAGSRDLVKSLGADEFVTDAASLAQSPGEVDVMFDLIGGELLQQCSSVVRRDGTAVSVVEPPPSRNGRGEDIRSRFFVVEPDRPQLTELARRIDAGHPRPVVGQVADLSDGARVWAAKRDGGIPGKVVLRPSR